MEKLEVDDRALAGVAHRVQLSAPWDKRQAMGDQLLRASGSVVWNLAEGARLWSSPQREDSLDQAMGEVGIFLGDA